MQRTVLAIVVAVVILLNNLWTTLSQGMPVSPCPKVFQYRFDGTEWFGVLSIQSVEFDRELKLRVMLSLRGKPSTHYLGDIELLTRGQFIGATPMAYKVKFPKSQNPPKLLQVSINDQMLCLGPADHGVFVTQIQLEHTRKFTFIPEDMSMPMTQDFNLPSMPIMPPSSPSLSSLSSMPTAGATDTSDNMMMDAHGFLPTNAAFGTKHFSRHPAQFSEPGCGTIDDRIKMKALQSMRSSSPASPYTNRRRHQFISDGGGQGMNDDVYSRMSLTGGGLRGLVNAQNNRKRASSMPLVITDGTPEAAALLSPSPSAATSSMPSLPSSTKPFDELPSMTRGAWPWMAAIYVNNLTSLAYQCGGTLVSSRIVISAAHCFHLLNKRYTSNELLVFLGRHNLKNWNEDGSLASPVDDIYLHPDFNAQLTTYDADIAILVLKNLVQFNEFIRPACIWSGESDAELVVGEHGTVVGWDLGGGINTTAAVFSSKMVPRIIDAPIVSQDECFNEDDRFRSLSSARTFCAGTLERPHANYRQRSGPCVGDSGAGLMLPHSNRWTLRGIVSATIPQSVSPETGTRCHLHQYVVYTDVAHFLDWILAFLI